MLIFALHTRPPPTQPNPTLCTYTQPTPSFAHKTARSQRCLFPRPHGRPTFFASHTPPPPTHTLGRRWPQSAPQTWPSPTACYLLTDADTIPASPVLPNPPHPLKGVPFSCSRGHRGTSPSLVVFLFSRSDPTRSVAFPEPRPPLSSLAAPPTPFTLCKYMTPHVGPWTIPKQCEGAGEGC